VPGPYYNFFRFALHAMMDRMDIEKMLSELRAEREGIEQAILVLERIAAGRGKRRGRPPAWMKTIKRRGRPKGSKNKP
jgi:hypothetical protein